MDELVSSVIGSVCCLPSYCEYSIARTNRPYTAPKWTMGKLSGWLLWTTFAGRLCIGHYWWFSRFAEIDFTKSTSANATIPKFDRIFSSYGIPLQLKSDNGPPFNSKAFSDYCKFMGTRHNTITHLHPRANGQVENFNKMINRVVRTSSI